MNQTVTVRRRSRPVLGTASAGVGAILLAARAAVGEPAVDVDGSVTAHYSSSTDPSGNTTYTFVTASSDLTLNVVPPIPVSASTTGSGLWSDPFAWNGAAVLLLPEYAHVLTDLPADAGIVAPVLQAYGDGNTLVNQMGPTKQTVGLPYLKLEGGLIPRVGYDLSVSAGVTYAVTLPAGTAMTMDQKTVDIDSLTVDSGATLSTNAAVNGTFTVESDLTNSGSLTTLGGTVNGSWYNNQGATADVTAATTATAGLVNNGTITLDGGSVSVGSGKVITNGNGGTINFLGDSGSISGGSYVNNSGLIEKTGGTSTTSISMGLLDTSGTVKSTSGTLNLTGGGTLTNTRLTAGGGATLQLGGGTFGLSGIVAVSGGGTVTISNSTVQPSAGGSATISGSGGTTLAVTGGGHLNAAAGGTLTLSASGGSAVLLGGNRDYSPATLGDGPGSVVNVGSLTWDVNGVVGAADGTGGLTNTGTITLSPASGGTLNGTLTNRGTITTDSGGLGFGTLGELDNRSGATINFTGDGARLDISPTVGGTAPGTLLNAGVIEKTGGPGVSVVDGPLTDSNGSIVADSGTLGIDGGGTLTNTRLTAASGAVLRLGYNNYLLNGAVAAGGGGTVQVSGTVATTGSATITGSGGTTFAVVGGGHLNAAAGGTLTLNMAGASTVALDPNDDYQTPPVIGDGPVTVINAGNLTWMNDGAFGNSADGSGGLTNTGTLTIGGSRYGTVYGTLTNTGTVNHAEGGIFLATTGVLANETGGTYNFTADGTGISGENGVYGLGGIGAVTNSGLFEKTGGTGQSLVIPPFNDTGGSITAISGTLILGGGGSLTNTRLTAAGGIVQLGGWGGGFTLAGTVRANGSGTVALATGATTAAGQSATITGSGGTTFAVIGGGHLNAAGGGTLTLNMAGASTVALDPNDDYQTPPAIGDGAGTVVNAGNLLLENVGGIGGNGTGGLTNTGTITVNSNYRGVVSGTLTNQGLVVANGSIQVATGGLVLNAPGGEIDLMADVGVNNQGGYANGTMTNAGLFRKIGGTGTSVVDVKLNNVGGGTIDVEIGTVRLDRGLTNAGTVVVGVGGALSEGYIAQSAGAVFTSNGAFTGDTFVNNGGTVTFGGVQQWSANVGTLTNNGGTAAFTTDPGALYASRLQVVVTGGAVTFASTDHLTAVTVGAGATAVVANAAGGGRSLLVTPSLTLAGSAGAWTGTLDLTGDDLDVPNGSLATLTREAAEGFADGSWNGSGGIVSSTAAADPKHLTAVGVIQNATAVGGATPIYTTFDGQPVSASDVLARYTYYGDTNLDGAVNAADYLRVDVGYFGHLTGWQNGDFNYDGVVDGSDYTLMDDAFDQEAPAGLGRPAAALASPAAELAGPAAAVPEPASLGLLLAGSCLGRVGRRPGGPRRPRGRLAPAASRR